jgi:hypothetical protein
MSPKISPSWTRWSSPASRPRWSRAWQSSATATRWWSRSSPKTSASCPTTTSSRRCSASRASRSPTAPAAKSAPCRSAGLPDVATTWNGRNIFTASGTQVALQDIPSTLVRQIDVYKTRDASQLENGIAGQIDVKSLRPFDFKGAKLSLLARGTHLDPADQWNPQLSGMASNRWKTAAGDFGALINLSLVKTDYRNESVTPGAMVPFTSPNAAEVPAGYTPLQRIFDNNIWTPRHLHRPAAEGRVDAQLQRQRAALLPGARCGVPKRRGRSARTPGRQRRAAMAARRGVRVHARGDVQRLSRQDLQQAAVQLRGLVGQPGQQPRGHHHHLPRHQRHQDAPRQRRLRLQQRRLPHLGHRLLCVRAERQVDPE